MVDSLGHDSLEAPLMQEVNERALRFDELQEEENQQEEDDIRCM